MSLKSNGPGTPTSSPKITGWGLLVCLNQHIDNYFINRASLRSKKDRSNIDSYRGFIEANIHRPFTPPPSYGDFTLRMMSGELRTNSGGPGSTLDYRVGWHLICITGGGYMILLLIETSANTTSTHPIALLKDCLPTI